MRKHLDDKTISSYLDGRCDDEFSCRIESHFEICPACRLKVTDYRLAKKMLVTLEPLDVSESFDAEFDKRLNREVARSRNEGGLEKAVRRLLEDIKTTLTPAVPKLAMAIVAATIIVISIIGMPYYFAVSSFNIVAVSGEVTLYSSRMQKWVEAENGLRIKSGDILKTGRDGQVDVAVKDIFTVRLKDNAELKTVSLLPRYRKGLVSYELIAGKALIDIHQAFKGSRFEIKTPQAVAKALGTRFALDVSGRGADDKTVLAVLHGAVEIKNRYASAGQMTESVIVKAGQKTEVLYGKPPAPPSLLIKDDWNRFKELYQLDRVPQVVLLISATESRVRELLKPCALYIYDREPRTISERLERAVEKMYYAVLEDDMSKHLDAISQIETIIEENPHQAYNPQLLLFIGTYYEYLDLHERAIATFEKVVAEYPNSQFASLAQCAIGIIYNEKLGKKARAREVFEDIILRYPNSLEVFEARKALEYTDS